jgi:(2R)-ethylmalonyl-CoA mutase
MRFVTEMCKMRAFVDLWDEICEQRYGVDDPKYRRFRYGVQVNSLGLTEPQRKTMSTASLIQMLAVVLSKNARARAVQLPAWNEALGLPRPWDQQWSLRMQQVMAYETDLLEFADMFDGSKEVDAKVEALKDRSARRTGADRGDGRGNCRHRDQLHEAAAGGFQHGPPGRHRKRRADGGWRQPL